MSENSLIKVLERNGRNLTVVVRTENGEEKKIIPFTKEIMKHPLYREFTIQRNTPTKSNQKTGEKRKISDLEQNRKYARWSRPQSQREPRTPNKVSTPELPNPNQFSFSTFSTDLNAASSFQASNADSLNRSTSITAQEDYQFLYRQNNSAVEMEAPDVQSKSGDTISEFENSAQIHISPNQFNESSAISHREGPPTPERSSFRDVAEHREVSFSLEGPVFTEYVHDDNGTAEFIRQCKEHHKEFKKRTNEVKNQKIKEIDDWFKKEKKRQEEASAKRIQAQKVENERLVKRYEDVQKEIKRLDEEYVEIVEKKREAAETKQLEAKLANLELEVQRREQEYNYNKSQKEKGWQAMVKEDERYIQENEQIIKDLETDGIKFTKTEDPFIFSVELKCPEGRKVNLTINFETLELTVIEAPLDCNITSCVLSNFNLFKDMCFRHVNSESDMNTSIASMNSNFPIDF